MLTLIGLIAALFGGGFFGWRLTAKNERMRGYAEAVDDQFIRNKVLRSAKRPTSSFHVIKGGK